MSNEPERKYTVYSENKSKNYVRFLIKNDGSEDSEAIFLKDWEWKRVKSYAYSPHPQISLKIEVEWWHL